VVAKRCGRSGRYLTGVSALPKSCGNGNPSLDAGASTTDRSS